MWFYSQKTGEVDRNGTYAGVGYSGKGDGKNNPDYQRTPDFGPIPEGGWKIEGPPFDTTSHGPYVMRLAPNDTTDTFGRSGFLIHGDSLQHPGEASEGCIILSRPLREAIWGSGDYNLTVTP